MAEASYYALADAQIKAREGYARGSAHLDQLYKEQTAVGYRVSEQAKLVSVLYGKVQETERQFEKAVKHAFVAEITDNAEPAL